MACSHLVGPGTHPGVCDSRSRCNYLGALTCTLAALLTGLAPHHPALAAPFPAAARSSTSIIRPTSPAASPTGSSPDSKPTLSQTASPAVSPATQAPSLVPSAAEQPLAQLAFLQGRAFQYSAVLAQVQARERQARARLDAISKLANPVLVLAGSSGQNTGGLDEGVILSESFALGDKRTGPILGAQADWAAARALVDKTRLDLALAVEQAYVDVLRTEAELGQARVATEVAQAFVEAARAQLKVGDVPRSHLVRARLELDRAEREQDAARAQVAICQATLASLVGNALGLVGEVAEDAASSRKAQQVLEAAVTRDPEAWTLQQLQACALAHAPDLRAARCAREARVAELRTARAQGTPDLFVEGRSEYLNPLARSGGTSVRLGLSLPLLDLGSMDAQVRLVEAELAEQQAVIDETRRQLALDVETRWHTYQQARRGVQAFADGRLDRARQLLDMMRVGYKMGASSYLEVLDATRTWAAEQNEYLRSLAAYHQARAALRRALGGSFP